ncbi:serine protease [Hallella sp.]|uniref:S1 family peptidase n=1 Tax=Hallella sp. TaxID=2980186 RepID=UPI002841C039|nr:serine protease [Hallella sp.]MDR3844142.1 serine protease [Hallella sp.]
MKKAILLITTLLALVSCSERTPQDLFDEDKSGVVLILNEYYYTMKLPNGNTLYFTGIDNDGSLENLSADYNDIKGKRQTLSGTGFFIDKQGTIMTNRHVAQPAIDKKAVKESYNSLVASLKAYFGAQMEELADQYRTLENQKSDCVSFDFYGNAYQDEEKLQAITTQQGELEEQFNQLRDVRESMNDHVSLDELQIAVVCEVGIAYNNTYVTSSSDLLDKNPCVVTKVSGKEDTDLALIQLKNKTTPEGAYVFNTDGKADVGLVAKVKDLFSSHNDEILQIDQQLYMIGYNAGPLLANTKQGIQVQMTSGKVTQLPDGDRLLYSIPTVQGSSGSPVIDSQGRLVAVNFAKLAASDNFNFGIPLNKVKAFLKP